jgi:hypothetical protein
MAKTQTSKPKSDKPFLAARIPYGLEQALETHVKSTNENKTQAIIKALSVYLKWSDEGSSPNASDRLSKLERKVAELEKLLKTPKQTSFLDAEAVIKKDINTDNKKEKPEPKPKLPSAITEDIKVDNITVPEFELKEEEAAQLMTHKELSELTGKKYSTVKARARSTNRIIKWEGRTFGLIRLEGQWRWKEILDNKQ